MNSNEKALHTGWQEACAGIVRSAQPECGKEEVLVAQKGDRVVFRIAHAYLPEARELLADLTDQTEVEGTITEFSDAGEEAQAFALVRLYDSQTVVVPVEKLRVVTVSNSQLN